MKSMMNYEMKSNMNYEMKTSMRYEIEPTYEKKLLFHTSSFIIHAFL